MTDRRSKRTLLSFVITLALVGLALVGCGSDTGLDPQDIDFVDELQVDLSAMTRTASGLYFLDLMLGDGAVAEEGDRVVVDYAGWLPNGAQFDAGTDTELEIGPDGGLIQGFDEGVRGMHVGGTRSLVIPPDLAYGDHVVGGIPANSTLVFRVTLKDIL